MVCPICVFRGNKKPDFWVRAASWGVDGASLGFPRPPQIRKKRGDGGKKNTINMPIFLFWSVMGRENTPPIRSAETRGQKGYGAKSSHPPLASFYDSALRQRFPQFLRSSIRYLRFRKVQQGKLFEFPEFLQPSIRHLRIAKV